MNGFARSSTSSNTKNQQQPFNTSAPQQRQPNNNNFFDFRSIYEDDPDDFFEAARNFPASGRQSVPVGFRAGELHNKFGGAAANESNDTSSGYSTASSIAPSSTYWTRKADNDSEFVPIRGKNLRNYF